MKALNIPGLKSGRKESRIFQHGRRHPGQKGKNLNFSGARFNKLGRIAFKLTSQDSKKLVSRFRKRKLKVNKQG